MANMPRTLVTDMAAKQKTSRIYDLCAKLFPDEFGKIFVAKREVFRDWMNAKTGSNCDHITDKHHALDTWLSILEYMNKG